MPKTERCSRCGKALPTRDETLCPACLLELGLSLETALIPTPLDTPTELAVSNEGPSGQHRHEVERQAGDRIGHYRLLRILGEGGMGVVYLAEQEEPIRRTVALKLIKLGMDTRDVVARFQAERQALALMDHPNIASVLDAGATDDGRPYFVMEYVPGQPITEYCDRQGLSTSARLQLFITVCGAVQHAHQKGIIHRDLKPSNVLVTEHDGEAIPKVIDFGIAKATDQRLTERTLFTQHGLLVGTPEYMSPEQTDATSADLDTRTDIYALGVVLYELLVGGLPFSPTRLREAGYTELLRIIREEEPPRPSSRLTHLGGTAADVAARRRTKLPTLASELRGDLDWITLKALEKDRGRRYGSASELAADVGRYLQHEPVVARPPSLSYRVGKFVRRNRLVVTAASLVSAATLAGLVVSTVLYVKEGRARHEAVTERTRADAASRLALAKANDEAAQRGVAEAATAAEADARLVAQSALQRAETSLYFNNVDLADREIAAGNVAHADDLLAEAPARLRNWEWHYLSRRAHLEAASVRLGAPVFSVAATGDAARLIAATGDLRLVTIDRTSRQLTRTLNVGDPDKMSLVPRIVALSPDGSSFAALTSSMSSASVFSFNVWDARTGATRWTKVRELSFPTVAFTPDSRFIWSVTTGGPDRTRGNMMSYRAQRWNVSTGAEDLRLPDLTEPVERIAFSADGRLAALISGRSIQLADGATGAHLQRHAHSMKTVAAAAVTARKDMVVVAGPSGLQAVDAASGAAVWSVASPRGVVTLAISPDDRLVAFAGPDRLVRILDRSSGAERTQLTGHSGDVHSVVFIADTGELASASDDGTVKIWQASSFAGTAPAPARIDTGGRRVYQIDVTESQDVIAVVTGRTSFQESKPTIEAWNLKTLAPLLKPKPELTTLDSVVTFRLSADGTRAALAGGRMHLLESGAVGYRYNYQVAEFGTGAIVRSFDRRTKQDRPIEDPAEMQNAKTMEYPSSADVDLHAGRGRLAVAMTLLVGAAAGGTMPKMISSLDIWNLRTGVREIAIEQPGAATQAIRLSPDGRRLAAWSATISPGGQLVPRVLIHDTMSGRVVASLTDAATVNAETGRKGDTGYALSAGRLFAFSRDGHRFAAPTSRSSVTVWDTETGRRLFTIPGTQRVDAIAFSRDDSRLAYATADGVVTLVETQTGRQLIVLRPTPGPFEERRLVVTTTEGMGFGFEPCQVLAFSPDDRQIRLTTITGTRAGGQVRLRTWTGR